MSSGALILATVLTLGFAVVWSETTKPEICLLNLDVGSCNAGYFTRWYYDRSEGECKRFFFQGCGGNENRFETLFQCQKTCQHTCQLPPETGLCRAAIPQWHYNNSAGQCTPFTYGGCGGNDNRFNTKALCENACKPGVRRFDCPERNCKNTCNFGYELDSVGCPLCICKLNPNQEVCPLQKCSTTDQCYDRYAVDQSGCKTCECRNCGPVCLMRCGYYNRDSNRFYNLDLKQDENGCSVCNCHSRDDLCGVMQCDLECRGGYAKDSYGCDLCQCRNPARG